MKPFCEIKIDGIAVEAVTNNLKSATVALNAGKTPDKVELLLADPLAQLPRPRAKAKITVVLGYYGGLKSKFGPFVVDQYSGEFDENVGDTLLIVGTSIDFNSLAKSRNSMTHKDTTLRDILQKEAKVAGFTAIVDDEFGNFPFAQFHRGELSFVQMASELAEEFDAIDKYEDKKLLFLSRTGGKNIFGDTVSLALTRDDLKKWKWVRDFKADYKGVKASARDHDKGKRVVETAELDEGDAFYEIRKHFPNRNRAKNAANSKAKQLKRQKRTIDFTLRQGDPRIIASMDIGMNGLSAEANRTWVTKTVSHIYDFEAEGYDTQATAENKV